MPVCRSRRGLPSPPAGIFGSEVKGPFQFVHLLLRRPDVLSKSAQIYLTARSMGFEPAGTTQEQMDELKRAFNL